MLNFLQNSWQSFLLRDLFFASTLGQLQEQSVQEAIQGVLQSTGMLLLVAGALLLVTVLLRFAAQMDALPKPPLTPSSDEDDINNLSTKASISLVPQPYQSISVQWSIPMSMAQTFSNNSHNALIIRLLDVTDMDLAYQQPHAIYDYPCELTEHDRPQVMGIAVPESDRDYIAELGYHSSEGEWCQLARSSHVRVKKA